MADGNSTEQGTLWDMGVRLRHCARCKEVKSVTEFYANRRNGPEGRESYCKACRNIRYGLSKQRHAESKRRAAWRSRIWKKYGLTPEDYELMLEAQDGICAICGLPERAVTGYGRVARLGVDHSHRTKKVRALLCRRCNAGIGNFGENIKRLEQAIAYLRKHGCD